MMLMKVKMLIIMMMVRVVILTIIMMMMTGNSTVSLKSLLLPALLTGPLNGSRLEV